MKIRKIRRGLATVIVVAILSASGLYAAAPAKKPSKASAPQQKQSSSGGGKHCLWRVGGGKAPVYLLGSIHAMRRSDYPLAPVIRSAMEQSRQFYFEFDPKLDAELGRKMRAAAVFPQGVQIKGKIRPETYSYLLKITRGGANIWPHLKPWAIAHYLLQSSGWESVRSDYGIDNYVIEYVRGRHLPTHGLESIDEHVQVFSGMSEAESETYLLEALVFSDQSLARFRETVAAWKVGDTERIFALEMPEIKETPGLNPRFLDYRNARWIPKIEAAIKSGQPTLIVAGCMHFSGPKSVNAMLRARGYTVEQL